MTYNNRYLYQGKACLKKLSNVTEACECFTSSSFNTTTQAVRGCDASTFSASIKAQLNKCKAAFSTCRKYEDDAVDALSACSKTQQQHSQKVKQRENPLYWVFPLWLFFNTECFNRTLWKLPKP